MTRDELNDVCKLSLVYGVLIFGVFCFWVIHAHFEAQAYNRLTGAHATTWDAMFVELRVQDKPKESP